eukprot:SAG11_NODE_2975_length_2798_cov_1.751019_2_plen_201_part_00
MHGRGTALRGASSYIHLCGRSPTPAQSCLAVKALSPRARCPPSLPRCSTPSLPRCLAASLPLRRSCDFYATFCGLAGVEVADEAAAARRLPPVDSLDMWPMLSGAAPCRCIHAATSTRDKIEGRHSPRPTHSGAPWPFLVPAAVARRRAPWRPQPLPSRPTVGAVAPIVCRRSECSAGAGAPPRLGAGNNVILGTVTRNQ